MERVVTASNLISYFSTYFYIYFTFISISLHSIPAVTRTASSAWAASASPSKGLQPRPESGGVVL